MNYCYDLRFTRPAKATIAKRVKAIAKTEGMDVDDNAAEMLAEANGNDIRQACIHTAAYYSNIYYTAFGSRSTSCPILVFHLGGRQKRSTAI